jgi:outer membrane lipoprotein carrier protein
VCRFACFVFPAIYFTLIFAAQAEEEVARSAAALQQRYAAVNTVSANFRQTYRAPGVEQVESGALWMKKPGLMRWEYRDPEIKLFVADGRDMYLYTPGERQVMVSHFGENELRSTPLQFLLGQGDINKSFDVSVEAELKPAVPGTVLLRLVPRSSQRDYAYVVLEFDEKAYDLRRIVIREKSGNSSEFFLTNLETNVKIDNKQFQFKIPKGVEVVRLEEKD